MDPQPIGEEDTNNSFCFSCSSIKKLAKDNVTKYIHRCTSRYKKPQGLFTRRVHVNNEL